MSQCQQHLWQHPVLLPVVIIYRTQRMKLNHGSAARIPGATSVMDYSGDTAEVFSTRTRVSLVGTKTTLSWKITQALTLLSHVYLKVKFQRLKT